MKAQSVRRILNLSCAVLGLAVVATGAYWFLQVRPAAAAPVKPPAWIEKAWGTYTNERKTAKPMDVWPVQQEDLKKHITRPDLMDPKNGIGVWPYVGPLPPAPRPPEKPAEAPKLPTGIESLGKVDAVMGLSADGLRGAYRWAYTPQGAPKPRYYWFMVGEFIRELEVKDSKGRFKVTKLAKVPATAATFVATYDVYDDPTKDPVERNKTATFNLQEGAKAVTPILRPVGAPATPGKPGPATAGTAPGPGPAVTPVFNPVLVKTNDNAVAVQFDDDDTYRTWTESGIEKMIQEIRTEEAKDKAGQPMGIRLASLPKDSDLGKFDIQPGDILKSINGQPTHSRAQAVDIVKKMPKDTTSVIAVVERNGRDIVYTVDPRDPAVRKAAGKLRTK
jgi:hypothetical protein